MLAGILELLYLLVVALSPLPGLRLSSTPLGEAWSWTLVPSHVLLLAITPLIQSPNARALVPSLLLGLTFSGLAVLYACALGVVRHLDTRSARRSLFFLLGGACIFGLTLLLQPRLFSDDVFTYIFAGRLLAVYGADPMNTIPIQFPADPYLTWVISGRDTTNIYAPLWLYISSLLAGISNNPVISLLLFKGLALFSHLLNSVLVWAILGKVAPKRQLSGTVLYAWNPLALIELAGSGHSEGVLLTILLLATWIYVQEPGFLYRIGILIILGLAISANLIALLLVPLYLWFDVRSERQIARALWRVCWQAMIVSIPFLAILLPFWRGPSTFFAITSAIDMEHFVHAPAGLLALPLRSFFVAVAQWTQMPAFLNPITAADMTLRTSATFIFILIYVQIFGQVRNAPVTMAGMKSSPGDPEMLLPGFDVLLSSWGIAIFWYLILVSGWFWPWYVLWMFWIIVLRRLDVFTVAVLILSAMALFIYPFVGFSRGPLATYQTALIFGIPLLYLIAVRVRRRRQERTITTHE